MIDLHCHILPGIDDGAQDLAQSLEMAAAAQEEGIHTIVATPHHKNGTYENEKSAILYDVDVLNKQIKNMGIDVQIVPGQEIRLYGELLEDYEQDRLAVIHQSAYMLVEFPSSTIPAFAEQVLFDIQMKGITPIIVHPERNAAIAEDPNRLYKLIKNGALSQVTAASVNGKFGKKAKALSMQLIESNLTHFLATDAHNTTSRGFGLAAAYNEIDPDYADYFQENAEAVLAGQYVQKEAPIHITRKKRFLGLF